MIAAGLGIAWTALVLAAAIAFPLDLDWVRGYWWPPMMAGWTRDACLDAGVRHLRAAGWLAAFGLAFLGAGEPVRRWLGGRTEIRLTRHVSWIGGMAALSMAVLGLGLAGLISTGPLAAVLGTAALGGVSAARRMRPRTGWTPDAGPWWSVALLAAGGVGALMAVLAALAPQVGYDALVYYYAAPRRALQAHRILVETLNTSDGYPHGFEVLFIPALRAGGEHAAKLLTWAEIALTGAALGGVLRDTGAGTAARRTAVALFWTLPFTGYLPAVSFSDGAVMHAAAAGFWAARGGRWRLAAACGGWMLGLKYSGVVVAAPLLALALAARPRRWAEFGALGAACALPWWLRNFAGHGQPFYPLLDRWLPGFESSWVLEPLAPLTPVLRDYGGSSVMERLGMVWGSHAGRDISSVTSFAVLWLAPAALAWGSPRGRVLAAGALAVWATAGNTVLRYLVPATAPLLAEAALALERRGTLRFAAPVALLLAVKGLGEGAVIGYRWSNPVAVALGGERPGAYLRRILTPAPHYMTLATESPIRFRGGRTLVLGDVKAYYWTGNFILDELTFAPRLARWVAQAGSPERLRITFRQGDIRHVVVRAEGMATVVRTFAPAAFAWTPAALAGYRTFWARHLESTAELVSPRDGTAYHLFDIVPRSRRPWPALRDRFVLPGTEPRE